MDGTDPVHRVQTGAHRRAANDRWRIRMARITMRHWCAARTGGYHDWKTAQTAERARMASAPIRHGSKEKAIMHRLAARRRLWAFDPLSAVRHLVLAVVALLLPLLAGAQSTDTYPTRPVKLLVPYAPGGATDIIARHISPKLQEALGQPFVVDNRPGASGNIALEAAAKAAPDGYTLEVGNVSTNAINESTFADVMQIRPSRDLVGISKLVEIPHVVVAATSFPPNSVAEMIEWAKRNPGKLNYASAGLGT